jgi:hypothetical protein
LTALCSASFKFLQQDSTEWPAFNAYFNFGAHTVFYEENADGKLVPSMDMTVDEKVSADLNKEYLDMWLTSDGVRVNIQEVLDFGAQTFTQYFPQENRCVRYHIPFAINLTAAMEQASDPSTGSSAYLGQQVARWNGVTYDVLSFKFGEGEHSVG